MEKIFQNDTIMWNSHGLNLKGLELLGISNLNNKIEVQLKCSDF